MVRTHARPPPSPARESAADHLAAIGDDRRASGRAVDPGRPPGDLNP
jgi:hypothetical protein